MHRTIMSVSALALLTGASGAGAQTVTITFEGFNNTIYNAPIVREGYRLRNPVGQEQHFHEITSTQFGLPNNGTGILLNDRNTEIMVVLDQGGTFRLDMVDVAASLGNLPAIGMVIRGFLGGGATGEITIPTLGAGYTAIDGSPLGVIDELRFDGIDSGGGFCLDNLRLSIDAGCYADCDSSTGPGVLDIFDFLCFQNRFAAGAPYACDCDTSTGPNNCDIFDFLCFQNAFAAGCP